MTNPNTDFDTPWKDVLVLIHIEIQGQQEIDFAERMFVYYYRIYDRYRRSVASLAVLGDDNASWRPNQFERELFDYTNLNAKQLITV